MVKAGTGSPHPSGAEVSSSSPPLSVPYIHKSGLVQFWVTRLDVGIVLVIVPVVGFSAFSITITASLSTSTKTGQTDCSHIHTFVNQATNPVQTNPPTHLGGRVGRLKETTLLFPRICVASLPAEFVL